ncbi:hypothetical protein A3H75_00445 [Candidatus Uhrbacteria bacterium RIFCSPLOWO2_02_FULL_51_9]|uniref:Lactamase n=1 Tax=Candidatus Uhrbacteria bacterium RIFCSPLOWO2_02_FULL_51_9 TaxID=1802410 RepID=A0A1F7VEK5_9BACT|nr:MAG: hypothetical protein A3H75_00445 [Candidatus Uhrbacteria bacterium RIFCSPLOWO2_02_FULL_51_9]
MHISWMGGAAVKLQIKNQDRDVTVVIDTYKPKDKGAVFPPTLAPDIALFSHGQEGSITLQQNPFIIDSPGEFEVHGVLVHSIPTSNGLLFQLTAEEMIVLHAGALKELPNEKTLEQLSSVDVLITPVGGTDVLNAKTAAALVTELEPRACIPIAFQYKKNDAEHDTVDAFLKEVGHKNGAPVPKVILSAAKLPNEDMEIIVLESN